MNFDRLAKATAALGVVSLGGGGYALAHGDMVGTVLFATATVLFGVATVVGCRS